MLKRRSVLKVVHVAFWAVRPIRYVRGRSVCYALTCGRLSSSAGKTLVYVFCVCLSLFLRPMEIELYAASSFMQHVYKRCTKRSQSIIHKPRSNFHISNTSRLMAMFRPCSKVLWLRGQSRSMPFFLAKWFFSLLAALFEPRQPAQSACR